MEKQAQCPPHLIHLENGVRSPMGASGAMPQTLQSDRASGQRRNAHLAEQTKDLQNRSIVLLGVRDF
jgi:hypothetical protein